MAKKTEFFYTEEKDLHFVRPLEIIREHPEIRSYMGRNRNTFWVTFILVTLQLGIMYLVHNLAWYWVLIVAYLAGAFLVHALFVMVHECSHNLIFQKKQNNTLLGIFANMAMFFPSSVSFQRYHLKHHAHQGVHEYDADLPSEWEARLVNNSTLGKALWLLLYPVIQTLRVPRMREIKPFDGWVALNIIAVVGVDVAAWIFLGPMAFVYLFASMFFSVGLHPLGARWVQEHYMTSDDIQETHSYYGPLNTIAFNVGHHNEHHDFPSVPWNNLPKVRQAGAKWYNSIPYHTSWTKLWLKFLFDRNVSIYHRMLRKKPEKKPVKA